MSPDIARRLVASLKYDVINGSQDEKAIFASQVREATSYINSQAAQIEALKEKLVEERANMMMLKKAQAGINLLLKKIEVFVHKKEYLIEARQQLKADPDLQKAGVTWDE